MHSVLHISCIFLRCESERILSTIAKIYIPIANAHDNLLRITTKKNSTEEDYNKDGTAKITIKED